MNTPISASVGVNSSFTPVALVRALGSFICAVVTP